MIAPNVAELAPVEYTFDDEYVEANVDEDQTDGALVNDVDDTSMSGALEYVLIAPVNDHYESAASANTERTPSATHYSQTALALGRRPYSLALTWP